MALMELCEKSLVELGEACLLGGQFEKAYWALNACFWYQLQRTQPLQQLGNPSLWQRGICCFYTGNCIEGAEQFEYDMSSNGNDIEEIIWNFLCRCSTHGFEKALSDGLLPLRDDGHTSPPIPPMPQVLDLYRGTGMAEDVIDAAVSRDDSSVVKSYNDTNALAYAQFYIGLYHEMHGEYADARRYLGAAAGLENHDFMGRLMGVHFQLFSRRFPRSLVDGFGSNVQHRLIQGGWQLSRGHSASSCRQDGVIPALVCLLAAFDAGVRVFDCGDIYTGVEVLYGYLVKIHRSRGGKDGDIAIHTKFVPDLDAIQSRSVDEKYIQSAMRRCLNRLGVSSVSLVQFHWWDMSVPGYVEALLSLQGLVKKGMIKNVGITNFDTETTKLFVDSGVQLASTQVQFSLLDRRPLQSGLVELCERYQINILAYGVLAGGFLTDTWLGKEEPSTEVLANRSLVKYLLIIQEFGGWSLFQQLLKVLRGIAERHGSVTMVGGATLNVTIAMVAIGYVLRQRQVKSVIIGGQSGIQRLQSTVAAVSVLELTAVDLGEIDAVLELSAGPNGAVYGLERSREGPHGAIMKYNLNQVNQGQHLEELCHRYLHLHFEGHPVEATRTGYRFPLPSSMHPELMSQQEEQFDFDKPLRGVLRACNYDHLLGPCSESEVQEYCAKVGSLLQEAEGVEEESLSPDQLVDLRLVISQLKLELVQWNSVQIHKKDPAFYLPLNSILYLLPAWGPEEAETSGDPDSCCHGDSSRCCHPGVAGMSLLEKLLAILSRLRAIPSMLIQAHRNLTSPLEVFVLTALDISGPFSSFLTNSLPALCDTLVSEAKSEYDFSQILAEVKSASAVAGSSVAKYASFLRSDVLPRSSVGVGVGKELYDQILKYSHFIDSSEELLALGERHFTKVKTELESLAAEIDPTKTWQEITADDIQPIHPSATNLLSAYMTEIERARDHMISHDLVSGLPKDEKVVGFSTPKFLIPFSPVGDYLNPSPFARMGCRTDAENIPRIGHLMLHSIEARNLPEAEEQALLRGHDATWISVVCPHESYPGHHVQALLAQDHSRILRQYHESVLFYEGWGLYTEELAWETGFFDRELSRHVAPGTAEPPVCVTIPAALSAKLTRLTQLRLQLWRAARIILDVKLNTGQLSLNACREFLHKEVMFNKGASDGEVFMYASRPGYASCYIAGFVMIMELREEMRTRMESEGRSFQLKEFHDNLLSKGCIPFELLRVLL